MTDDDLKRRIDKSLILPRDAGIGPAPPLAKATLSATFGGSKSDWGTASPTGHSTGKSHLDSVCATPVITACVSTPRIFS